MKTQSKFIFPLGGHPKLNVFNTTIKYTDISIETWLQLLQNNFLGIDDPIFVKQRYKLDCDLIDTINWFKYTWLKSGIFIFYKDMISRELWNNVNRLFVDRQVIGLARKATKDDNIILVNDLDTYEIDKVCRILNKFLLTFDIVK